MSQRAGKAVAGIHQRIELAAGGKARGFRGAANEQPGIKRRLEVEDLVADRNSALWLAAGHAENTQRQVLNREIRFRRVGRSDPALAVDVVGFVEVLHGGLALFFLSLGSCGSVRMAVMAVRMLGLPLVSELP